MGRRATLVALATLLLLPAWLGGVRGAAAEQCFAQIGFCVSGRRRVTLHPQPH